MVTVTCPYCRTVMEKTCGCSTFCVSCKAKFSIDSNGRITRSSPPKSR